MVEQVGERALKEDLLRSQYTGSIEEEAIDLRDKEDWLIRWRNIYGKFPLDRFLDLGFSSKSIKGSLGTVWPLNTERELLTIIRFASPNKEKQSD